MKNLIKLSSLWLVFFIVLNSCGNLGKAKLKENPDFEKNAERFVITSPISPASSVNKYILENQVLNKVYEMKIEMEDSYTDTSVIEEEEIEGGYKTKTQEFTSHKFYILNPVDSSEYEVVGKTTYFRTREEEGKESFEIGKFVYPIDFWIFEDGKDVGKITLKESGTVLPTVITFHNNDYNVEYQNMFNKVSMSFEDGSGLIALIALKPKSTITTTMKGEILINRVLSEDLRSDIFTLYLMVEAALRKIQESGV
jgi:hypothetical protein